MFQINLIRDRVIPKNLFLKRTVIAGSVIGFMLLVGIVIAFMGFKLQPEINDQENEIKAAKELQAKLEEKVAEVKREEDERDRAKLAKARLAALWHAPMHMGVLYELIELLGNDYKKDAGYKKTGVAVRHVWFEAGKNNNQARIVMLLKDKSDVEKVRDYVKRLLGEAGDDTAKPSEIAARGGMGAPEVPEAGEAIPPMKDAPKPEDVDQLDENMRYVIINIPPLAAKFYEKFLEQ